MSCELMANDGLHKFISLWKLQTHENHIEDKNGGEVVVRGGKIA